MKNNLLGVGRIATALAGCFLLFIPKNTFAWGGVGHRVVGIIAQDRLTPQALRAVQAILGQNSQGQNVSLQDVANCPDELKFSKQAYTCESFTVQDGQTTAFGVISMPWKASSSWHFTNVENSGPEPTAADIENSCPAPNAQGNPAKDCVMSQIKYDIQVLSSPQSSQSDRQIALMFLVHFVGDEHQPLHINDDNDAGGNKEKIVFEGQIEKLHQLWDNIIEPRYDYYAEKQEGGDAASLAAHLEQDLGQRDVSSWISGGDTGYLADEAAVESFDIAKNVIRPVYAQDYDASQSVAVFGQDYQQKMQPIAYEQLEKAGVRLAFMLNQIFSSGQTASSGPDVVKWFTRRILGIKPPSLQPPSWDGRK